MRSYHYLCITNAASRRCSDIMLIAALALALATSSFYAQPAAFRLVAVQRFTTTTRSLPFIAARANSNARRKASTTAKKRYGKRGAGESVNEYGVDLDTSMKAVANRKLEVLLLKSVDGLGEAGQLVSVSIPMFENALRPSKKAKLPTANERTKLLATQLEPREESDDGEEFSKRDDSDEKEEKVQKKEMVEVEVVEDEFSESLPSVAVYDGVFSASALSMLASDMESSMTWRASVDAPAGIYRRGEGPTNTQEHAIESLLVAMGDVATREVEFWSRDEWLGMEAHRDVDEEAACRNGELRMPSRVIIVYGECEAGLRAPTVLWGDNHICDDGDAASGTARVADGNDGGEGGLLVVIPAVPGRVLSFSGSLLHAVPKPAIEWLGSGWRGDGDAVGQEVIEEEEEEEASSQRPVFILNCWPDHAPIAEDEDGGDEEDSEYRALLKQARRGAVAEEEEVVEGEFEDKDDSTAAASCCAPRHDWSYVAVKAVAKVKERGATEAVAEEAAESVQFGVMVFGSDEPFVTDVDATAVAFAAALTESEQPRWLRTASAPPANEIGSPSMEGAREER